MPPRVAFLEEVFSEAENDFGENDPVAVTPEMRTVVSTLFVSKIQSPREALIGVCLARILDKNVDVRLPYVNLGENAFNGRSLDEEVVNPFLKDRMIPCSAGPYLAMFRRSVSFNEATAKGTRDREGYEAVLQIIGDISTADEKSAITILRYLLYGFASLREASRISLRSINRLSLNQLQEFIIYLLQAQSGGLMPVLITVATLETIKERFGLSWNIAWQDINVSDKASGALGDVTVKSGDEVIMAFEITERPIDGPRVISTFDAKISVNAIDDYLFLFTSAIPKDEAKATARRYFAQGHDIDFVPVKDWVNATAMIVGSQGRADFMERLRELLSAANVPASVKVGWNDAIHRVAG